MTRIENIAFTVVALVTALGIVAASGAVLA